MADTFGFVVTVAELVGFVVTVAFGKRLEFDSLAVKLSWEG